MILNENEKETMCNLRARLKQKKFLFHGGLIILGGEYRSQA